MDLISFWHIHIFQNTHEQPKVRAINNNFKFSFLTSLGISIRDYNLWVTNIGRKTGRGLGPTQFGARIGPTQFTLRVYRYHFLFQF